jgi:hypothetical protein
VFFKPLGFPGHVGALVRPFDSKASIKIRARHTYGQENHEEDGGWRRVRRLRGIAIRRNLAKKIGMPLPLSSGRLCVLE